MKGFDLVFVATDDEELNRRVVEKAEYQKALVNVADSPELCDFSKNQKSIYLLGFSYKTSPLHVREKALDVLKQLRDELDSAVLLSTCNRVELYFSSERCEDLLECFPYELKEHLQFKAGRNVFKHLTLVASGCNSLALGETQIAGQVKRTYYQATKEGKTGKLLSRLFEKSFKASKAIKKKTEIQNSSVSVPYLAVKLAERKLSGLEGKKVGILGTGDVAQILLKNLKLDGIYLIGRNRKKLASFSEEYFTKSVPLDELEDVIRKLELLFVATSSPVPLVEKEQVEETIKKRKILIIDLSVPRNVEEDVRELENVECVFVDELEEIASENLKKKEKRLKEAKEIAQIEAEKFQRWYENLETEEIIISFLRKREKIPDNKLFHQALERIKWDKELALAFKEIFGL